MGLSARGDFVVLPLLAENSRLVAVGRIEGGYQDNELHSEFFLWLKKDVPKSEFEADLVKSLGYRGYCLPPRGIYHGR